MKPLLLHKMQGCGNDFLIADASEGNPPDLTAGSIRRICHRQLGVGADGLFVLLPPKAGGDAAWTFYNSDGSLAEMCGNAARCAIRFLAERRFSGAPRPLLLETRAGVVSGRVLADGRVEVSMPRGKASAIEYQERVLSTEKGPLTLFCINSGVPHAVIEVKDILSYPIREIGRLLVRHAAFSPEGTNVTFYQRMSGNRIRATTFERGVENETLACGTGAVAAALVYTERYLEKFPIEVAVPGGALSVEIESGSKTLLLTGPAEWVFTLEYVGSSEPFDPPGLYSEHRRPI